MVRRLYKMVLSQELPGLKLDFAANGAEAVAAFLAGHHGVLIMDIHMPVMDGRAAYYEIEKLCKLRNLAMPSVVFCTGYAPPEAMKEIVRPGSPHCLLVKPVTNDQLTGAVRQRLN